MPWKLSNSEADLSLLRSSFALRRSFIIIGSQALPLALLIQNPCICRPGVKQASDFLWWTSDVNIGHIGHVRLIFNFQAICFILTSCWAAFGTHFAFLSFVRLQEQIVKLAIIGLSVLASPRQRDSAMFLASGENDGLVFGVEVSTQLHVAYFI